jgi:hypothetical protein
MSSFNIQSLCSQIGAVMAQASNYQIQSVKYGLDLDRIHFQNLLDQESQLRRQIYQQTGLPAYQLCEYCEPNMSSK